MKCNLTLINPDNEEKAVYEFLIPAGAGKNVTEINPDEFRMEVQTMISFDNGYNTKARFQSEIEKFFFRHDFIVVDHLGNIRIGDDIVGKFDKNGLEGRGKFIINTTYPFEEKTALEHLNRMKPKVDYLAFVNNLLNGTIKHNIECEFTVSRSTNGEDYFVTYTGNGTYKLLCCFPNNWIIFILI